MQELTTGAVVLLIVNLAILIAICAVGWLLRRIVRKNDEEHEKLASRLGTLERDSRDDDKQLGRDVRAAERKADAVGADLREHYPKRTEVMRMHGSVVQTLNRHHDELMSEVKALPCKQAACPTGAKA